MLGWGPELVLNEGDHTFELRLPAGEGVSQAGSKGRGPRISWMSDAEWRRPDWREEVDLLFGTIQVGLACDKNRRDAIGMTQVR